MNQTHHNVKSIVRSRDYEYARTQHSFESSPGTLQRDTSGAVDFSPTGASSTRKTDGLAVFIIINTRVKRSTAGKVAYEEEDMRISLDATKSHQREMSLMIPHGEY